MSSLPISHILQGIKVVLHLQQAAFWEPSLSAKCSNIYNQFEGDWYSRIAFCTAYIYTHEYVS